METSFLVEKRGREIVHDGYIENKANQAVELQAVQFPVLGNDIWPESTGAPQLFDSAFGALFRRGSRPSTANDNTRYFFEPLSSVIAVYFFLVGYLESTVCGRAAALVWTALASLLNGEMHQEPGMDVKEELYSNALHALKWGTLYTIGGFLTTCVCFVLDKIIELDSIKWIDTFFESMSVWLNGKRDRIAEINYQLKSWSPKVVNIKNDIISRLDFPSLFRGLDTLFFRRTSDEELLEAKDLARDICASIKTQSQGLPSPPTVSSSFSVFSMFDGGKKGQGSVIQYTLMPGIKIEDVQVIQFH